jgi:hypothetical protein
MCRWENEVSIAIGGGMHAEQCSITYATAALHRALPRL